MKPWQIAHLKAIANGVAELTPEELEEMDYDYRQDMRQDGAIEERERQRERSNNGY
jgi:hypothetical protein